MVEEERRQSYGTTSYGRRSDPNIEKKKSTITFFSDDDDDDDIFATDGLSDSHKIGERSYGRVYRGYLDDIEVAIKVLDANSQQGFIEFNQEKDVLARTRHPNIVKLIGACTSLRSLVFEFLPNGSVEDCLRENPSLLTWQMRTRIAYEICSALAFLHSKKPRPLVHGDIKPGNILLDSSFGSKLTDFGLCRFLTEGTMTNAFFQPTSITGTQWYMDPEVRETGRLTTACDLYSYGVTILRLLTGMEADRILVEVRIAYKEKSLMTMVDPTAGIWPLDVSGHLARLGLKCCRENGERNRSTAEEIMKELEGLLAATNNMVNKEVHL